MKKDKILYLVIGLLIIVIGYLYFTRRAYPIVVPTSSLITEGQDDGSCKTSDLETTITFEVAAGTTYGTPTMKNIGSKSCTFDAKNYIDLRYDLRTVQNVTIAKQGSPDENLTNIEPGQTLYSLLTYPNGAQCGSETKAINVQYVYRIAKQSEVTFKGKEANPTIQVCTSSEKTEVKVWPLSTSKISQ